MIVGRNTRANRATVFGIFALLTLLFVTASAVAQSDSNPKWDAFAGYQWMHPGASVPIGLSPNITPFQLPDMARGLGGSLTYNFDPHFGFEGDFGYSPPVIMELGGVRQLIVWHSRALVGLNPSTGKRLWAVPFEVRAALTAPTPIPVGSNRVFVTSFYNGSMLVEVGADAAKIVWKGKGKSEMPNATEDLHSIMTTPVLDGTQIYGVCSHGQLRCIQSETGARVWADMSATRGKLTSAKVAANPEPDTQTERWGHAFIVKQADRYFLFNEQGDLIIAKLSPKGYQELDRAHILDPTNTMARGRKVVWTHPAFANQCAIVRNDAEIVCVSLAK